MTIRIEIPQRGVIELQHAVFDVNGTLAVDGIPIQGTGEKLKKLSEHLSIHLITAGTHGNLPAIRSTLGFPIHETLRGDEKMRYVQNLGPASVIAFGNGSNDASMLRLAAIGVVVVTSEGISTKTLLGADVVATGPLQAIDLLLKPERLIATLRG
ncbi:HAD family hydrolase [Dictyobacter aurantiacus]|uniref:HAD family hydrolase n=1 Tax=Dictyobacter aurantiacus TaxID=1936993 RepID=UPI000F8401F1|nr:HAD hydrolase family protein [Dictyobacter aurantiacus]